MIEPARMDFLKGEMNALAVERTYADDFVLPDYEKQNVRNIQPVVDQVFGITKSSATLTEGFSADYGGIEKVIFVILDGLGFNRLLTHMNHQTGLFSEMATKGALKPITTTFPSTTSTALTSIFTGLTPLEHGIIGYQMFSKEYGFVFNTLDMKPVYDYGGKIEIAENFSVRVKPWMQKLENHAVDSLIVTKGSIVGSGLSRIIHRNQNIISYQLSSDMLAQCKKILELDNRTLLTVYYSGIDTMEHRYGPYSEETAFEIQSIEYAIGSFIEKLSNTAKKKTLMIVLSDHGVSEVSNMIFLKDIPRMTENLLLPPVGDSRATFMYSKPGKKGAIIEAFDKYVPGFRLITSKILIDQKVFGQAANSTAFEENIGDLVALSNSQSALAYPYFEEERSRWQRGAHGGMTKEEIIVPLISSRLSDL